jgi:protein-S-isoprenylcysteine O-methyltransferase Ste14
MKEGSAVKAMPVAPTDGAQADVLRGVVARLAQVAFGFVGLAAILFLSAGTIDWPGAWTYLAIYLAAVLVIGTTLLRRSPGMIAERGRPRERGDDVAIASLWAIAQYLLVPLVAGLDVRFGWTGGFGPALVVAGGIAFAAGLGLFGWAMTANAFFSTAVRIQADRGQTVCRSGPYRFVRHPGYLGADVMAIGGTFLLGSPWALAPAVAAVLLMGVRTRREDRMLLAGLQGYREYAAEVRHRIIPGIW